MFRVKFTVADNKNYTKHNISHDFDIFEEAQDFYNDIVEAVGYCHHLKPNHQDIINSYLCGGCGRVQDYDGIFLVTENRIL